MRRTRWPAAHLRLAAAFLLLVIVPSLFLGWFSLRAVETERRSRQGRVLENYLRYAEFAARAVRYELDEVAAGWQELATARRGQQLGTAAIAASFDSLSLAERFLDDAYVVTADGQVFRGGAVPAEGRCLPTPAPDEARLFLDLRARAEAEEFDRGDAVAAAAGYREILARVENPRLRAIAAADLARALLRAGRSDEALGAARRLLSEFPTALDLDNQPLRLVARWQIARALEERGDAAGAAAAFSELEADLVQHADALASTQYEYFAERVAEGLERLRPGLDPPAAAAGGTAAGGTAKKPVGQAFWVNKLDRKLLRAVLDEQPWAPRLRYLSDVADGEPFLLAYVFLPDAAGTGIAGIAGFVVDLPRLSRALLPRFLQELELSDETALAVLDEDGRRVIGEVPAGTSAPVVRGNLGEPFEFWNVAVYARGPGGATAPVEFRTKVLLYVVLLLLLAIAAGAVLVVLGARREARLAQLKTSFVSNVSHELRTPLTSIRMYAEMLETNGGTLPEAERRRQLGVIRSECGRLERLLDAVLDFASLQRGTRNLQFEYEEVGALVRTVAESFRGQAEAQGFEFLVDVQPDLPEVRVDADAMRQVLLNLLSNAVKYSEDERWIALRAYRCRDEVALEVEDHGIGIDPGEQQRIFEDFYRVDERLASPRRGVGLGLTLVRRLVEAHRGRVSVQSARGRGSRFTVWLPVEPAAAPSPPGGHVAQEA
jgi:signal transduction histidine kinase